MSEEKEILVTKTNSSLSKYIVEKDTRFDVVNSEQIIKRLKQEIEAYKLSSNEAKEIIAELEYKNKELKKKVNIYENSIIANHDRAVGKRLMEVLQALEEIRNILCNGRTFYEGYFDNPNLSRTDEAVKLINEVLNDRD